MKRRGFLAAVAALPLLGFLRPKPAAALPPLRLGVLEGELRYGGSATMRVFNGPISLELPTGERCLVEDKSLWAGETIRADTWVTVALIHGRWQVVASQVA